MKIKSKGISEESQIMAAIRKGKADVKAGRVKSHAQVEKLFAAWSMR